VSQPIPGLSPDDFLAWEREQTEKHLYVEGEVFAMAGGSPRHNRLSARIIGQLERSLNDPCASFTSDQKIGLGDDFVYADAVVICGPLILRPGTSDVATNPTVVVEVLSRSTEAYDRGGKQKGYLSTPTLHHFVLVSQREERIELYTRQRDGSFRFDVIGTGGTANLDHVGVSLPVDALYANVFELPGD
jgi:Uma2 family endonuclease